MIDKFIAADWKLKEIAEENNSLNASYFIDETYKNIIHYDKLKQAFDYILNNDNKRPLAVLEIGVGCGWSLIYLEKKGMLQQFEYSGMDVSLYMCEKAKLNCPHNNFFVGNIENNIYDCNNDIVIESAVIELVCDWKQSLINMLRSSKKWFIAHRLFFTEEKETKLEQVTTYLNLPDIRYTVSKEEFNNIILEENFIIVKEDIWCLKPYKMGTFVIKKNIL